MHTGLASLPPEDIAGLRAEARVNRAWPFEEARRLVARYPNGFPAGGVVFETGYGPSGLPHIGTFAEVARTTMVRRAFELMCPDVPTRLIAFSDDMDGMRKVPPGLPRQEELRRHLGRPLSSVPDPFGTHESFAAHNNARLRAFLDRFGFDYEFLSATDCYRSGRFDAVLRRVLERWDEVVDVVLPTLGPERRATYAPFLPLCPHTGRVLQVPIEARDPEAATVVWRHPDTGKRLTTSVLGGAAKLQWKVDWAMRWVALGVDYEMAGKDLSDSVRLSSRIARILGGRPPEGFIYELFLDETGAKISKTRGNGLTIEEWLDYASPESLAGYLYQQPRAARKLHAGVIPRAVDDYFEACARWPRQDVKEKLGNPAFHVHGGPPPAPPPVPFGLLLNLVAVAGDAGPEVVGRYLARHDPAWDPARDLRIADLVGKALAFHRDRVAQHAKRRAPDKREAAALAELDRFLAGPSGHDPEAIQTELYAIGRRQGFANLRDWFRALYEILLGRAEGPRMGTFLALLGPNRARELIAQALMEPA
ncbi:MAG: lysine--tRNA ligase [Sphingomonadaceae bacterium]|uniref:lysine--tRNA ligase n=1 Tax=Thermaurantiacus sp. TaxID=2820283 RepID=UPI00298EFC00|nr:lysine--tRNA ligase [Thermaurantiacus sp.]MCS6987063.1 lysine--tRNA ligase [Sphingomonadaceae bacterium]MDW8415599.1 lysine--tRNA ligase [Thermaurantiacus sp.]